MASLTPLESSNPMDWQTSKRTVRDRTAFLFNNSLMSDIKFVLTDSDGTQVRVPAHKLVLAISSPVFEAMFYGELAEKREEIDLPDTEPPFLLEFLRFLYCDEVRLTTDNAFGVLYLAQKYIVPLLAEKCWSFIDNNTCACLKSDKAVSALNQEMLTSLAKRDTLKMKKEVELFEAMEHWAEARCKAGGLEPSGEAMRKTLGDVGKLIRWPTISLHDFALHVVPTGILTDKEALDVYEYYSGATPGRKRNFSYIYRAGAISDAVLHECRREFKGVNINPERCVREINERLDFKVETRNVHLKGIQLFTGTKNRRGKMSVNNSNAMFTAEVRLLSEDGEEVAAMTGDFQEEQMDTRDQYGCWGACGIVVEFSNPVLIWKALKYTLEVKLRGVDQGRLLSGIEASSTQPESATGKGICFRFEGTSSYIYKLLFYKLDN